MASQANTRRNEVPPVQEESGIPPRKASKGARRPIASAVSAADESMIITVVRSERPRQRKERHAFRPDKPRLALISLLIIALMVVSINTPFAQLEVPKQLSSATVSAGEITISGSGTGGSGITSAATGPAPDPGSMHVLYWLLLAVALIPLEIEWRKKYAK